MALRRRKPPTKRLRRQLKDPWSGTVAIDTLRAELTAVESAAAAITAITTKPPSKSPCQWTSRPSAAARLSHLPSSTPSRRRPSCCAAAFTSATARLRSCVTPSRLRASRRTSRRPRTSGSCTQHQQPKSSHGYKAAFALTDAEELEQQRDALANERAALDRQRQELERRQWESGEREAACEAARQSERESERVQRLASEARESALRRSLAKASGSDAQVRYLLGNEAELRAKAFESRSQVGGARAEVDGLRRVSDVMLSLLTSARERLLELEQTFGGLSILEASGHAPGRRPSRRRRRG